MLYSQCNPRNYSVTGETQGDRCVLYGAGRSVNILIKCYKYFYYGASLCSLFSWAPMCCVLMERIIRRGRRRGFRPTGSSSALRGDPHKFEEESWPDAKWPGAAVCREAGLCLALGRIDPLLLLEPMIRELQRAAILSHGAHNVVWGSRRNCGMDLQRYCHLRAD